MSTPADLALTPWAQRLLKDCNDNTQSRTYLEAMRRAGEPVEIYHTTITGEPKWAVVLEDDFWMDALDTQEEAEALVAEMNWPKI